MTVECGILDTPPAGGVRNKRAEKAEPATQGKTD